MGVHRTIGVHEPGSLWRSMERVDLLEIIDQNNWGRCHGLGLFSRHDFRRPAGDRWSDEEATDGGFGDGSSISAVASRLTAGRYRFGEQAQLYHTSFLFFLQVGSSLLNLDMVPGEPLC